MAMRSNVVAWLGNGAATYRSLGFCVVLISKGTAKIGCALALLRRELFSNGIGIV